MLGSIIGNIASLYYKTEEENEKKHYKEIINILHSNTPLFTKNSLHTKNVILNDVIPLLEDNYIYGNTINNKDIIYISSMANYYDDLEFILKNIKKVTALYNNIEYIKGIHVICTTIYLAKNNCTKNEIKSNIENNFNYSLDFNLLIFKDNYNISHRISNIISKAIYSFLISDSFEDSIKKSILIGKNCNMVSSITGSISEAYYGIPDNLKNEVYTYLSSPNKKIIDSFYEELTIKNALKKVNITNQNFIKYMRTHTKRYNLPYEIGIWGCFIKRNKNNTIKEVKIIVPNIISEKTLLINIHEYTHAYEIYKRIGTIYEEDIKCEEQLAKKNELLYLKKTVNKSKNN